MRIERHMDGAPENVVERHHWLAPTGQDTGIGEPPSTRAGRLNSRAESRPHPPDRGRRPCSTPRLRSSMLSSSSLPPRGRSCQAAQSST